MSNIATYTPGSHFLIEVTFKILIKFVMDTINFWSNSNFKSHIKE